MAPLWEGKAAPRAKQRLTGSDRPLFELTSLADRVPLARAGGSRTRMREEGSRRGSLPTGGGSMAPGVGRI